MRDMDRRPFEGCRRRVVGGLAIAAMMLRFGFGFVAVTVTRRVLAVGCLDLIRQVRRVGAGLTLLARMIRPPPPSAAAPAASPPFAAAGVVALRRRRRRLLAGAGNDRAVAGWRRLGKNRFGRRGVLILGLRHREGGALVAAMIGMGAGRDRRREGDGRGFGRGFGR